MRKFLNSKGKKVPVIVCITLIIVFAVLFACNLISNKRIDLEGELAEKLSGDVGYNENLTPEMNKVAPSYEKLENYQFELNNETKTISFSKNIEKGVFCVSTSPNGPVEGDKWMDTNADNSYDISGLGEDIKEVYVYYMAKTTTMTNYDSTSEQITISSASELKKLGDMVNAGKTFSGQTIILTNDISVGTISSIGSYQTSLYTGVLNEFSGTFDGRGHKLTNITITDGSLFNRVKDGTIKNLTLETGTVTGGDGVGAIAGYMTGTLENCKVNLTSVSGTSNVGGLVGRFSGTIRNCENTSKVTSSANIVGGIIGSNIGDTDIYNCINTGNITAQTNTVGGIVGINNKDISLEIRNCINEGTIKASTEHFAGGILGAFPDSSSASKTHIFYNCKNTGAVTTATGCAGGMIGMLGEKAILDMKYCINEGSVTAGTVEAAGMVGYASYLGTTMRIEKCFNSGAIKANQGNSGGIVGNCTGISSNSIVISNCGNAGNISMTTSEGYYRVAGIVGNTSQNTRVEYCYNTGNVTGYCDVAGIAVFAGNGCSASYCYVSGKVSDATSDGNGNAGVILFTGVNISGATNNYFKGSYGDNTNNAMYRSWTSSAGWQSSETNVTSFSVYSSQFSQNNYGLLASSSNWALKWQIPPTVISHPFDVMDAVGATKTINAVVYGAKNQFTYQWYEGDSMTATGTAVDGANSSSLNVTVSSTPKYYYCEITGKDYSGVAATAKTERAYVGTNIVDTSTENATIKIDENSEVSSMTDYSTSLGYITINNLEELQAFANKVNSGVTFENQTVILNADITVTSWTPIGKSSTPFKGTFDGCGHTISGLNISSSSDYVGFFGYSQGTIKNLIVSGTAISGANNVGGIAGYSSGTIENCINNVPINATGSKAGGIVGDGYGTIKFCQNKATVTAAQYLAGGIMGNAENGDTTIFNCKNSGNITLTSANGAGGILGATGMSAWTTGSDGYCVGTTKDITVNITYCTNTGNVVATQAISVGGIVGEMMVSSGMISNCRNEGTITAGGCIGGIAGAIGIVNVNYCINTGAVSGSWDRAGGIVGIAGTESHSSIKYCYNKGTVTLSGGSAGGILGIGQGTANGYATIEYCGNIAEVYSGSNHCAGGIVGNLQSGVVTKCFNTANVTGDRYVAGIVGAFTQTESFHSTIVDNYTLGYMKATSSNKTVCGIANWVHGKYTGNGNNYYGGSADDYYDNAAYIYFINGNAGNFARTTTTLDSLTHFVSDTYYQNNGNKLLGWQIAPTILRNPFDVLRPVGTTETLSVEVYGGSMSYQWYVADSHDADGTPVTGARSSSVDVTVDDTEKWYYCVVTGKDASGATVTARTSRALVGAREYELPVEPNYSVNGVFKTTLEDAYNAIKATGKAGTIKVEKEEVTDDSNFLVEDGMTVTIDTNGKMLTKTVSGLINEGTLIINGTGTIQTSEATSNAINYLIDNRGNVIVNNGTLINNGRNVSEGYHYVIYTSQGEGNITVNGGTLKGVSSQNTQTDARVIFIGNGSFEMTDGNIIVDGVDVFAIESYSAPGFEKSNREINISGGYIKSSHSGIAATSAGAQYPNTTKINVSNVTIESDVYGIMRNTNSAGEIIVGNGTIIDSKYIGIYNDSLGNIVIGESDNAVSNTSPIIKGAIYGIDSVNGFNFYDGILKGVTSAYTRTAIPETGYTICYNTETIDTVIYQTAYLKKPVTLEVNPKEITMIIDETVNVDLSYNGDGELSITDSEYVETTIEGNIIKIKALQAGAETLTITATEGSDYEGATTTINLKIKQRINPVVSMPSYEYAGEKSEPSTGNNLGNGDVTYYYNTVNSNKNGKLWSSIETSKDLPVGTYYIYAVVSETTNYSGAVSEPVAFEVTKGDIDTTSVSIKGETIYGETLVVDVSDLMHEGVEFEFQWYSNTTNNTTDGTLINGATENYYTIGRGLVGDYIYAEVKLTNANYNDTTIKVITATPVVAKDMNSPEIKLSVDPDYADTNRVIIVTDRDIEITEGTDYTLTYDIDDVANTTTITATGMDNYKNSKTVVFEGINQIIRDVIIGPKDLETSVDASLEETTFIYDGSEKKPKAILVDKTTKETLAEGTDYTVKYSDNIDAGKATATIIGSGDYEGTIILNFTITASPTEVSVVINGTPAIGQTLTTSVSTESDGAKTYQWWWSETAGAKEGKAIDGATEPTYTIEDNNMVGKYIGVTVTVAETNNYKLGTGVASTTAPVSDTSVLITTQPESKAVKENTEVSFVVSAEGSNLSYQWYVSNSSTATGTAIEGATNATYTISASKVTKELNGKYYYCVVSNSNGSAISNSAMLTVYYAPVITTHPTNKEVTATNTAVFSVEVTDGNPIVTTYKWQYRVNSTGTWVDVTEAQGTVSADGKAFTTVKTTVSMSGYEYRCVVGNSQYPSAVTSNAGKLTVNAKDISSAGITVDVNPDEYEYTGSAITLSESQLVVKDNGTTLKIETDYTVNYTANTNVGTATITITGKGNYSGTRTVQFEITRKPINVPTASNFVYDGQSHTGVKTGDGYTLEGTTSATNVGTYTVTAKVDGNHMWSDGKVEDKTITWSITERTITSNEDITVTVNPNSYVYTGSEITLDESELVVKDNGTTLKLERDYTVDYENNTNVGTATVTIKGKGNYTGTKTVGFEITRKPIDVPGKTDFVYDGTTHTGVQAGTGYILEGTTSAIDVDTYTVTAKVDGNHMWSNGETTDQIITWSITKKSVTVTAKAQTITFGGSIIQGTEYAELTGAVTGHTLTSIVLIADRTNVGTGTITPSDAVIKNGNVDVTANYNISYEVGTLTINASGSAQFVITLDKSEYTYDGTAKEPTPTVTVGGEKLNVGTDYTVFYDKNTDAGTAEVIIKGAGNYAGSTGTKNFTINQKAIVVTAGNDSKIYDGKPLTSNVISTRDNDLVTGHSLTASMTPESTITNVGTVSNVIAEAMINITDSNGRNVKDNYDIETIAGTLKVTARPVTITANNQEVTYGTSISKTTNDITANNMELANGQSIASITLTSSITNVGTGTITPTNVKIVDVDGTTEVTSNYNVSYINGTVVVKAKSLDTSDVTVSITPDSYVYTGSPITPTGNVKVVDSKATITSSDYDISFSNNENVGTATVTVTGKENYTGTKTASFTITRKPIDVPTPSNFVYDGKEHTGVQAGDGYTLSGTVSATKVGTYTVTAKVDGNHMWSDDSTTDKTLTWNITARTITSNDDIAVIINPNSYVYTGSEITLDESKLVVKDNETTLKVGTDYTVSYENNKNVGTATVTITGKGNYTGTKTATFEITRKSIDVPTASNFVYDGQSHTGVQTGDGYSLTGTTSATNVGEYTVTAKLDGNHKWSDGTSDKTITWKITKKAVTVTAKAQTITFGGSISQDVSNAELTGAVDGHTLASVVLTADREDVGTGTITPSDAVIKNGNVDVTANYSITYEVGTLTINASGSAQFVITLNEDEFTYDGTAKTPIPTVKVGDNTLKAGTDYTVSYDKNTDAGTAEVIIKGTGNYAGSTGTKNFTIAQRALTVTAKDQTITYGGSISQGANYVTLTGAVDGHKVGSVILTAQGTNAGTGTITPSNVTIQNGDVDTTDNYQITYANGILTITAKSMSSSDVTVSINPDSYVYTGSAITPTGNVSVTDSKATITTSDYDISFSNNENVGTATVTVTGKGNYSGTKTTTFAITRKPIKVPTASDFVYDGQSHTGVQAGVGYTLDGDVTATNVGTYTVTAKVDGNHMWSDGKVEDKTITWNITEKSLDTSDITITVNPNSYVYTGSPIVPTTVTVTDSKATITSDDYDISYSNNTNVGTAIVTITGKGNYTGTKTTTFAITRKPIDVPTGSNFVYDGQSHTGVQAGTGYTLEGDLSATNVGTYTVIAKLDGNYKWSDGTDDEVITWKITKKAVTVTAKAQTITFGESISQGAEYADLAGAVTGHRLAGVTLTPSIENVGTGTITPSGAVIKNGEENVTSNYDITYEVGTLIINSDSNVEFEITLDEDTFTYDGTAKTPTPTVKVDGKELVLGTDYTVSYDKNTDAGSAVVIITGAGNYAGSTGTENFTINPKAVTVTAKAQSITYGGTISQGASYVTLSGAVEGHKVGSVTLTPSRTGVGTGTITPSVATITNSDATKDMSNNYTITYASGTLTITAKSLDTSDVTVSITPDSYVYTGSPITPTGNVKVEDSKATIKSSDYDISFSNNENVGTATVTVTGKGNYTGTKTTTFAITRKPINVPTASDFVYDGQSHTGVQAGVGYTLDGDVTATNVGTYTVTAKVDGNHMWSDGKVEDKTITWNITGKSLNTNDVTVVVDPNSYVYTGSAIEPTENVKVTDSKATIKSSDYDISFSNNENVGTATVTITGKGNYTGTKTATFEITRKPIDVPTGSNFVYDGQSHTGVQAGTGYKLEGDVNATNAGTYTVIAKLDGNYMWSDGTEDKTITWNITKKAVTVTAKEQSITYGENIAQGANYAELTGAVEGHTLSSVTLVADREDVGTGTITPSNAVIKNGNIYVTNNYSITYEVGTLTISSDNNVEFEITLNEDTFTYDGEAKEPTPTVKVDGKELSVGTDYTVSYDKNTDAGTAVVIITGAGNYAGSNGTKNFTINPKAVTVTAKAQSITYGGSISQGADYVTIAGTVNGDKVGTVTLTSQGTNVGTGTITPSGATIITSDGSDDVSGNYSITYANGTLTITAKSLDTSDVTVSIDPDSYVYTGSPITPTENVSVTDSKATIKSSDYDISFSNNTNVGTATVTVTGKGNYTGTKTTTFAITRKPIEVPGKTDFVYDGTAHTGVQAGVGYTLDGDVTATNVGTYTVTAKVDGNYMWSDGKVEDKTITWNITEKSLDTSDITITVTPDSYVYTGSPIIPTTVTVEDSKATIKSSDYDISFSNNTNVGTAIVTVTGKGNYSGTKTAEFAITRKPIDIPSKNDYIYSGVERTGVQSGAGYRLEGDVTATDVGTYTVIAIVDGNHMWSNGKTTDQTITWSITKKSVTVTAKAQTITYGESVSQAVGNADVSGVASGHILASVTLTGDRVNVGTGTITPSNAIIKNGDVDVTANYDIEYADGILTITAKSLDTSDVTVSITPNSYVYTGNPITPTGNVNVTDSKATIKSSDYDISFSNNTNVGTAIVTVTGKGNYTGTKTITFEITRKPIDVPEKTDFIYNGTEHTGVQEGEGYTLSGTVKATDIGTYTVIAKVDDNHMWSDGTTGSKTITWNIAGKSINTSDITITVTPDSYVYTGSPIIPTTVTVEDSKATITEDDYEISFSNNTNVGTAIVTVTGKGNYSGTKTAEFEITRKEIDVPTASNFVYDGQSHTGVQVGTGYTLSGTTSAVNANTYTAVAKLDGNHKWSDGTSDKEVTWKITPKQVEVKWEPETEFVYDGNAHPETPTAETGIDGETIVLENTKETNAKDGVYTSIATIKAVIGGLKTNYELINDEFNFTISKSEGILELNPTSGNVNYGTAEHTFEITSKHDGEIEYTTTHGEVVIDGNTVKVTGIENVNAGTVITVTITVGATGNYEEITKEYKITVNSSSGSFNVELPTDYSYVYDGKEKRPEPIVTVNGTPLTKDGNYTVSYSNNIEVGEDTAVVTVTGIGNYSNSSETKTFTITPRPITVQSGTASKVYDGTELEYNVVTVIEGELAEGHSLTATFGEGITNVGEKDNIIQTLTITALNGDNKTDNYIITKKYGKLTITEALITGSVVIKGENKFGETLTAKVTVEPDDAELTYKWYSNDTSSMEGGELIDSANGNTCEIVDGLVGRYIYVEVIATKANYTTRIFKDITDSEENGTAVVRKADITPVVSMNSYVYGGNLETPSISGNTGNGSVTYFYTTNNEAKDGIEWTNDITSTSLSVGTYYMYAIVGETTNYNAGTSNPVMFKVRPNGNADFDITLDDYEFTYDGEEQKPGVTVIVDGKELEESGDYTFVYEDNVDAGEATVIITGKGNYEGTIEEITFTINKKPIEITAGSATKVFDGTELVCDDFSVTSGDVVDGDQIKVITSGGITNVGTIANTISRVSIYNESGDVTRNYEVTTKPGVLEVTRRSIDDSDIDVTLSQDSYEYDGTAKEPNVTVKSGDTVLIKDKEYTVEYGDNVNAGPAKVIINATGDYEGTKEITFTIRPRAITIRAQDASKDYDGEPLTSNAYEIISGTLVDGHTVTITTSGTQTEIGSSINTITSTVIKDALGNNVSDNYDITTQSGILYITGEGISGYVTVTGLPRVDETLVANTANITPVGCMYEYEWYVSNTNSIEGGTLISGATGRRLVVKEDYLGKYIYVIVRASKESCITRTFMDITNTEVIAKGIDVDIDSGDRDVIVSNVDINDVNIRVEIEPGERIYNDSAYRPGVTIYDGTTLLIEGKDYELDYQDNINAGDAKIVITGKDIYNGTRTETFVIARREITIKPIDASKIFDNTALKLESIADNIEYVSGDLVEGHSIEVVITGEITNVGVAESEITSYVIYGKNGTDNVTDNYKVNTNKGELEVKPAEITGNVVITGTNKFGETLEANVVTTPDNVQLTYQWFYNNTASTEGGTKLEGATGKTYKVGENTTESLVGKYIYVVVTAKTENYGDATFKDITDATNNGSDTTVKADPTLTVEVTGKVTIVKGNSLEIKYSYSGDGIITESSTDDNIVTSTIAGDKVVIKGVNVGTGIVSVIANEGINYNSMTVTIDVEVIEANYVIEKDGKETFYNKLEDAVKDGGVIKVIKDVTDTSTNIVINKDVTIDLGEFEIHVDAPIIIVDGGELVIDGDEGSALVNDEENAIINNGGSLIIGTEDGPINDNPRIEGNKNAISGDFTFNGGTLVGTNEPPYTNGTPTITRENTEIVVEEVDGKYEAKVRIESTPPTIEVTQDIEGKTNKDVTLTIIVKDTQSGVDKVTYTVNGVTTELVIDANGKGTIKVSENGVYEIIAVDKVGNESKYTHEVKNIDKSAGNITGVDVQGTDDNNVVTNATVILENIKVDSDDIVKVIFSNTNTAPTEGSEGWLPYTEDMKTPWILDTSDGNGDKVVYAWIMDEAGNISDKAFEIKVVLKTKLIGGINNKARLMIAGIDKNFSKSTLKLSNLHFTIDGTAIAFEDSNLTKDTQQFVSGTSYGDKFIIELINVRGSGKIMITVDPNTLYDIAGNANEKNELETDIYVDTNAPSVSLATNELQVADVEDNLVAVTVNGVMVNGTNGVYGTVKSGDVIKAYDKAGNVTIYEVE